MAVQQRRTYDVYEIREFNPSYVGCVKASSYKGAMKIANNRYGAEIIVQ
jgi:hypothetical protein